MACHRSVKEKQSLNKDIIIKRIAFSEISKKAITEALENSRDVDLNLVNAKKQGKLWIIWLVLLCLLYYGKNCQAANLLGGFNL